MRSRGLRWAIGLTCIAIIALGLGLWIKFITSDEEDTDPRVNADSTFEIVALGDSYMSGEGARSFLTGTDRPGINTCRRASTAYPYLVAEALDAKLRFVACSGATTEDILSRGQQPNSSSEVFGRNSQLTELKAEPNVDIVLVSIGGNDAGFGEVGRGCTIGGDCRDEADAWIRNLTTVVYPALVQTFTRVREAAPEAEVFVATYPNPLGPKDCVDLLSDAERRFLANEFIPRLNDVIEFAALASSVRVIDLEGAFIGHRICEVPARDAAANVIGLGRSPGSSIVEILQWGHNTFHPNAAGHRLMAALVNQAVADYQEGRLEPLPAPPPSGIRPPPFVPSEFGPPVGPFRFPDGSPCTGDSVATVTPVAVTDDHITLRILDGAPGSLVCHHDYKDRWDTITVPASGTLSLPLEFPRSGLGSLHEVLYQPSSGGWAKVVIGRN